MKNTLTNYTGSDFFNNFFDMPFFSKSATMKTNIATQGDNYIYEIDIPGYEKEELAISYNNQYLTIEATKQNDTTSYLRQEKYLGTTSRSFYVGDIDESKITAKYKNGVLYVTVPSKEKDLTSNKKQITIE